MKRRNGGQLGTKRYLEDLAIGQITKTHTIEVRETEIIEFAARYDPQPLHTNAEFASEGPFSGLIASGWHVAALVMRLMVDCHLLGDTPLVGLGVDDLRWPKPVRPGDVLDAEIEVVSIVPSKSSPHHGIVRMKITAQNQRQQVVFSMTPNVWIPRRPL